MLAKPYAILEQPRRRGKPRGRQRSVGSPDGGRSPRDGRHHRLQLQLLEQESKIEELSAKYQALMKTTEASLQHRLPPAPTEEGGDVSLRPPGLASLLRMGLRELLALVAPAHVPPDTAIHDALAACDVDPFAASAPTAAPHPEVVALSHGRLHGDAASVEEILADAVAMPAATGLDVSHNGLTDDHVELLASKLKHHANLRALSVSHNPLTSKGAIALSKALTTHTSLTQLEFTHTSAGRSGISSVLSSLVSPALSSLAVSVQDMPATSSMRPKRRKSASASRSLSRSASRSRSRSRPLPRPASASGRGRRPASAEGHVRSPVVPSRGTSKHVATLVKKRSALTSLSLAGSRLDDRAVWRVLAALSRPLARVRASPPRRKRPTSTPRSGVSRSSRLLARSAGPKPRKERPHPQPHPAPPPPLAPTANASPLRALNLSHTFMGAYGAEAVAAGLSTARAAGLILDSVANERAERLAALAVEDPGRPPLRALSTALNHALEKRLQQPPPTRSEAAPTRGRGRGRGGTRGGRGGTRPRPRRASIDLDDRVSLWASVWVHGADDVAVLHNLTTLNLDFCGLNDVNTWHLFEAVKLHTGLTSLSLRSNDLGDAGGQHLAHCIRGPGVEWDAGFQSLGGVAKTSSSALVWLDVGNNPIGEDGGAALVSALYHSPTLKSLGTSLCFGPELCRLAYDAVKTKAPPPAVAPLDGRACVAKQGGACVVHAPVTQRRRWVSVWSTAAPASGRLSLEWLALYALYRPAATPGVDDARVLWRVVVAPVGDPHGDPDTVSTMPFGLGAASRSVARVTCATRSDGAGWAEYGALSPTFVPMAADHSDTHVLLPPHILAATTDTAVVAPPKWFAASAVECVAGQTLRLEVCAEVAPMDGVPDTPLSTCAVHVGMVEVMKDVEGGGGGGGEVTPMPAFAFNLL